jgi:hypothetical protein
MQLLFKRGQKIFSQTHLANIFSAFDPLTQKIEFSKTSDCIRWNSRVNSPKMFFWFFNKFTAIFGALLLAVYNVNPILN